MLLKGQFKKGKFIERPNRFMSIVEMEGKTVEAHLPNPGRIKEILYPGVDVILRKENGSKRKTGYTLVMVYKNDMLISLNTTLPNKLTEEALKAGKLECFKDYKLIRREVQYKNSRFDFLLEKENKFCFLEVKSVSLVKDRKAMFPDAPTIRGTRHLHHLMEAMDEGYEAAVLFVIQRDDADSFSPHHETDPVFAKTLREAYEYGVKVYVHKCNISLYKAEVDGEIKAIEL
ncbi:DNA/RNA nuclease SfsA [Candidatus Poribacteria bacterium]|nr:DNA/RNA nuclease SfsA [Candidatus Poribacteria bacterium]